MTLRCAALFLLTVSCNGFDLHKSKFVRDVVDQLGEFHTSHLKMHLAEHIHPHEFYHDHPHHDGQNCGQCVQGGTSWLMKHSLETMKSKCVAAMSDNSNSPKACIFRKVCTWMGKHPRVSIGMMLEHVRPLALSTAFCTGKGACAKPKDHDDALEEILEGENPHEALLDNFDEIDWSEVREEATELMQTENTTEDYKEEVSLDWTGTTKEDATQCAMGDKTKVCPWCMKKAMAKVVFHAIMKVRSLCVEENGEKMKKMCAWMGKHKPESLGMLLAKVEPWKFAKGWCMHKAKHHGHHGHHGHHSHHERPMLAQEEKGFKGGLWGNLKAAKEKVEAMVLV